MRLDRITVAGFKSIRELDNFELRPLNILIGANGAGKSNFITLFKLLNNIVNSNLQLYISQSGGADSQLYFGRKVTSDLYIRLSFGANRYEIKLVPSAKDNLVIAFEECRYVYPGGQDYPVTLGVGKEETGLTEEIKMHTSSSIAGHVMKALKSWKVYHFHDTSENAKVKQMGDIGDNRFLRPDAGNLAAYLYHLHNLYQGHYERIVGTIRLVAPFFDDFTLRPWPDNPNKIRIEWREKGSDTYFDSSYLSDGTLRFICLTTLLQQPNLPSTLLIDEPELGLHPYAIAILADMLKSAATKTQVIVSTQSVPLVNQLNVDDVVVVNREDNQSVFKRYSEQELENWLGEYSLGELWEMNVLGGRP